MNTQTLDMLLQRFKAISQYRHGFFE